MAWRALARRCSRRSMTVVGDLQQTTHPAGARDWHEALDWAGERVDLHTLTVTYRITEQIADTATSFLLDAGGDAPVLHPVRQGAPTHRTASTVPSLPAAVLAELAELAEMRPDTGRIGVVVPDALSGALMDLMEAADPRFGVGDDAIDSPIAVLTARDTKGLEFDHVFVVARSEEPRLNSSHRT